MARLLLLLLVLSAAEPARRCNIPVFRYALERWHASPYEVIVFHKGPLDGEARAAVDALRAETANVVVDHIDLDREDSPRIKEIWAAQKNPVVPWMVAIFPKTHIEAWAGPAGAASARALLASPARGEIGQRLLAGDSAVFLLLESGVKADDDALEKRLSDGLRALEKSVKLPVHKAEDPPLLSGIPMKVAFSVLRLSRSDPAEKAFVDMLLRGDPGHPGAILFPVFGRGRALDVIRAEGLEPRTISEVGKYIAGPCACEVKDENPGVDLLLNVDWEQMLLLTAAPPEPVIPDPVIAPGVKPAQAPPVSSSGRGPLWIALGIAGLLVLITGTRALRRA